MWQKRLLRWIMKGKTAVFLLLLGVISCLGWLYRADSVLQNGRSHPFTSPAGEPLNGNYYPGYQPAGILILSGFGGDQVMMRSAVSEFAQAGVHVFTFDYSGHGRSPGTLTFDNAATDRLAQQVLAALEQFKQLSGLNNHQIILMGHSMGARVSLQTAVLLTPQNVAGLILLGASVNLTRNVQSETFSGIQDSDLLWVQNLNAATPPVPILLITGEWDDILTPNAARLLLEKLQTPPLANGAPRELLILNNLVHNYEPYSPRILAAAKTQASVWWGLPMPETAETATLRLVFWIIIPVALFLALFITNQQLRVSSDEFRGGAEMIDITRFLWGKWWLWLAALPVTAVLLFLFFLIPLGLPVFNLIYVGFIGAYGLLSWGLYRWGKMPGVKGGFDLGNWQTNYKSLRSNLLFLLTLLLLTTLYLRSGVYDAPPSGHRLWWLVIFTPFTTLGFWIGLQEGQLLQTAVKGQVRPFLFHTLISLFPFLLLTLFFALLGSISGLIGGLQGLVILAFVLLAGHVAHKMSGQVWGTAVFQSILLYWLVLPQGALFVFSY